MNKALRDALYHEVESIRENYACDDEMEDGLMWLATLIKEESWEDLSIYEAPPLEPVGEQIARLQSAVEFWEGNFASLLKEFIHIKSLYTENKKHLIFGSIDKVWKKYRLITPGKNVALEEAKDLLTIALPAIQDILNGTSREYIGDRITRFLDKNNN